MQKLLVLSKFKNNLKTSKKLLEIPRVRKTNPDLILNQKPFKKLLMKPKKISMIPQRSAKRLMKNLPRLLMNQHLRSRS